MNNNDRAFMAPRVSFSAEGQDLILQSILRSFLGNTSQYYYVDIGSNSPIIENNSFLFYQLGFSGYCIEANSNFAKMYKKYRPKDIFINKALSCDGRDLEFSFYLDDDTQSSASEEVKGKRNKRFDIYEEIVLKSMSVEDFINSYLSKEIREMAFCCIDVEGMDEEILGSLLKQELCPPVFIIEDKNIDILDLKSNALDLLLAKGYQPIAKTPLDTVYIKSNHTAFDFLPETMRKRTNYIDN